MTRTIVIVRDPRNVIMSERKMRSEYYKQKWVEEVSVDEFVRRRFEVKHESMSLSLLLKRQDEREVLE